MMPTALGVPSMPGIVLIRLSSAGSRSMLVSFNSRLVLQVAKRPALMVGAVMRSSPHVADIR